jgi:hypothetical protein
MASSDETTIDLGSQYLRATRMGGVLRVVLDRPERRNACTIEMYHGIKKAAVLAERDPEVDVLLLTATGDVFCVGGEMGGQHEGGQPLDRETDGIDLTPFVQLERCPKLVLVAVNGMCWRGQMTPASDLAVVPTATASPTLRGWRIHSGRMASRVGIARAGTCCSRHFVRLRRGHGAGKGGPARATRGGRHGDDRQVATGRAWHAAKRDLNRQPPSPICPCSPSHRPGRMGGLPGLRGYARLPGLR